MGCGASSGGDRLTPKGQRRQVTPKGQHAVGSKLKDVLGAKSVVGSSAWRKNASLDANVTDSIEVPLLDPKFDALGEAEEPKEDTISTAASTRSDFRSATAQLMDSPRNWPEKMLSDAPDHPFMIFSVFAFLPWSQRGDAMCLSRDMRKFFSAEDAHGEYWRWHCECLCNESLLVLPSSAPKPYTSNFDAASGKAKPAGGDLVDYKGLLAELWPFRFRFLDEASSTGTAPLERFRVSVFARMRPAPKAALFGGLCEELLSTPVTLPLGQRVQLMRQRHPEMTRAQAMRALLNTKCGAAAPMEEKEEEEDVLGGAVVQRPQTGNAQSMAASDLALSCGSGFNASVLSVTPGSSGSVLTVSPGIGIRKWAFAEVFGEVSTQPQLYNTCGHRLSTNLVNGQNGSLIVYGQTGSGKTHTMFGAPQQADGLIPRLADDILKAAELRREAGFKVVVGASIVEVFGNDVSNLLGKTGSAKLCARMGTKYVLEGRYEHAMEDHASFASLLTLAEERKRKAYTEMNERSTRAHTIVILRLRQRAPGQEKMVESVLSLVDLGGSERVTKSKAHENACAPGGVNVGGEEVSRVTWGEYYKSRERLTETNNINKGLLALKRCVQALEERQKRAEEGRPLVRVPYTDSKLTVLLQPALSGEANTSIVVCCSPEDRHAEETVQSLRFGEMCSSVEHERTEEAANDIGSVVAEAVREIDAELKEVELAIRAKEKWEWKKTIRQDVVNEMDTGGAACNKEEIMELGGAGAVEILADDGASKKRTIDHEVWSQVLAGADAENARREELLKTRQRLLGGD